MTIKPYAVFSLLAFIPILFTACDSEDGSEPETGSIDGVWYNTEDYPTPDFRSYVVIQAPSLSLYERVEEFDPDTGTTTGDDCWLIRTAVLVQQDDRVWTEVGEDDAVFYRQGTGLIVEGDGRVDDGPYARAELGEGEIAALLPRCVF